MSSDLSNFFIVCLSAEGAQTNNKFTFDRLQYNGLIEKGKWVMVYFRWSANQFLYFLQAGYEANHPNPML